MGAIKRGEGGNSHTIFFAILTGAALGVVVSVVYVAHKASSNEVIRRNEKFQTHFATQLSRNDQERSLLEQERDEYKAAVEELRPLATKAHDERDEVRSQLATAREQLAAAQEQLAAARAEAARQGAEAATAVAAMEAARATMGSATPAAASGAAAAAASGLRPGAGVRVTETGEVVPAAIAAKDRHAPWRPNAERDAKDPELAKLLRKVAVNDEVLVAISNANYAMPGGMLDLWVEAVQHAGVSNALLVALDQATLDHAATLGMAAILMHVEISAAQANVGSNHAVSGLKFRILRRFIELGYGVLLSDVDVLTLQNPFPHLARDCDVEGMSDGFDNGTAYGYNDVLDDASMGWARYAHSMRVFVINSGLFYLRPTPAAHDLLDRVAARLAAENGWDQAIFNEVIFFPSRPGYEDPGVTRRILDYLLFMNSKVLFKTVRHDPRYERLVPVMVHVNYHPNKQERMKAIWAAYITGDRAALQALPDGSER